MIPASLPSSQQQRLYLFASQSGFHRLRDFGEVRHQLDELGDEFTEEEVRLVRIKFISEMAN